MRKTITISRLVSLLLILAMTAAVFAACGKTDEEKKAEKKEEIESELSENADTLEERLALLEASEWEKTDEGYKYTDENEEDDSTCTFVISAKGNDATMKLTFDYGDDNDDMADFYKDDESVVKALAGYWFIFACKETEVTEGNVEYTFHVGDTKINAGTLSYAEAEKACEYFEE